MVNALLATAGIGALLLLALLILTQIWTLAKANGCSVDEQSQRQWLGVFNLVVIGLAIFLSIVFLVISWKFPDVPPVAVGGALPARRLGA